MELIHLGWGLKGSFKNLHSICRSTLSGRLKDTCSVRINDKCHNKCQIRSFKSEAGAPITRESWIRPEGIHTDIKLYNSLTDKKEPLILPHGRLISWYSCGPTVYDSSHIGHASSYVRQDIMRRVLEDVFDLEVVLVMGITDIDDKIIKRSQELQVDWKELTKQHEQSFVENMIQLNLLPAVKLARVTEHIPEIVTYIQKIMANGYAYNTQQGNVYFDIKKYGRYGQLRALQSADASEADATDKANAEDFALWKAEKPGEPAWESPWGRGRPGWHIECSAMASLVFGENLDIHSGGKDLKFPHHENELAQSQAHFCCRQWANYWIHTGHLHVQGQEKMSKSLNNTIVISDLLKKYTANQFRIFCMMRPYRHDIEYSDVGMEHAVRTEQQWRAFLITANRYVHGAIHTGPVNEPYVIHSLEKTKDIVRNALADDFNTPRALNAILELIRRCNKELAPIRSDAGHARSPTCVAATALYLQKMARVFGLKFGKKKAERFDQSRLEHVMNTVMDFRNDVRNSVISNKALKEKSAEELLKMQKSQIFQSSDKFRDAMRAHDIEIQDRGANSMWVDTKIGSPNKK